MNTDGNDTFDFQRDLNDNNNKIDSAVGKLSNLTTTQKGNLVGAINEIDSDLDEKASKDLDNLSATGQAIIDGKVNSADLYDENQHIKINKLQTYSLPSSTYDDLTLGASGSTYTAPADGWVSFRKDATGNNQFLSLIAKSNAHSGGSEGLGYCVISTGNGMQVECCVPCLKGDVVEVGYSCAGNTKKFRFWYAKGAQ